MIKPFKKIQKDINEIETIEEHPVNKEDVKKAIEVLKVAHETGCKFDLTLQLEVGDFRICSENYLDIKLLDKNKKESDRLCISYQDLLMKNETTIQLDKIIHIILQIEFRDKEA